MGISLHNVLKARTPINPTLSPLGAVWGISMRQKKHPDFYKITIPNYPISVPTIHNIHFFYYLIPLIITNL